ncbi:MAG: redoxin domain-containing protein [Opitutus sp.]|nr:redoxin domain-containing protein [Opitutus sp.]
MTTKPAAALLALALLAVVATRAQPVASPTVAEAIAAVEAAPDSLAAHDTLLRVHQKAIRANYGTRAALSEPFVQKYREWLARTPHSLGLNYGLGSLFYSLEDPRAKPHLLKVVELDPKQAKVFQMLSFDAERWGDEKGASDFMLRAAQADPASPDYAFYYASGLGRVNPSKWESASLEVARQFPTSERGAQALYWLGQRAPTESKRIAIWEQALGQFPPEKFNWTSSAMPGLFDAYLRTAPAKALAFAQEMERAGGKDPKAWADRATLAQAFLDARAFLGAGKTAEASALLDKLPVDRRSSNARLLTLLRAEITAGAGNVQAAYDSLAQRHAATPEDETRTTLAGYGVKLGKTPAQIEADIWTRRDAAVKPAPPFDLGLYTSDQKLSLASLRGKVVFVTFWFPGCGPCRGEFPYFEDVMRRFRGRDVVYLGINGLPEQDDYVLSFMAGTKYSFTPLRGTVAVTGSTGYVVRGYPANFLIDRDGRVVYRDFRAHDAESNLGLQRMIESLLDRTPAAQP